MKLATVILGSKSSREKVCAWAMSAPPKTVVQFKAPGRTIPQNDRLHAIISKVAQAVEWNGKKRDVEAWKDIFTAALLSATHDLDVVPGINGGFVLLGLHTSSLSVEQCGNLMMLVEKFAAEHGVDLGDVNER